MGDSGGIKNFEVRIEGTLGFDQCQVTRGGVALKDVNQETYESKLLKGIYFIGEVLDVDGECGGFNMHFAFASASRCAEALLRKYEEI